MQRGHALQGLVLGVDADHSMDAAVDLPVHPHRVEQDCDLARGLLRLLGIHYFASLSASQCSHSHSSSLELWIQSS